MVSLQPDVLSSQGGGKVVLASTVGLGGECFVFCGYLVLEGHFFHFSAPWQSPDSNLSYALKVVVLS